jgi:hypothetical protein
MSFVSFDWRGLTPLLFLTQLCDGEMFEAFCSRSDHTCSITVIQDLSSNAAVTWWTPRLEIPSTSFCTENCRISCKDIPFLDNTAQWNLCIFAENPLRSPVVKQFSHKNAGITAYSLTLVRICAEGVLDCNQEETVRSLSVPSTVTMTQSLLSCLRVTPRDRLFLNLMRGACTSVRYSIRQVTRVKFLIHTIHDTATCISVTTDEVWISNWIYWTLWHTTRDYTLEFTVTYTYSDHSHVFIDVAW